MTNMTKSQNQDLAIEIKPYPLTSRSYIDTYLEVRDTLQNQRFFVTRNVQMGEVLLFEPALFCVKNNSETEIYEVIKHMKQIKQKFPDFYNSLFMVFS